MNPYQIGDMVIFYDSLHAGNYTKTLITYIQKLDDAVIMNIKKMEVLSNEEKCC
jgi:hypothetical protein